MITMTEYFLILLMCSGVIKATQTGTLAKDLRVTLPSGDSMPVIGFGTGGIRGPELMERVLDDAFTAGYRLIDTAHVYKNEEDIGKALKVLLPKHNLTRKDVFITSKLAPRIETYGEHAYEALKGSVQRLGYDYVDLYLIHFPAIHPIPDLSRNFSKLRDESWQQLVRGVKDGLARNIGVSNYNVRQLRELLNNDHGIKPAVNQVEWHPEYHQDALQNLCNKEGVKLQAYFSLGGSVNKNHLLQDERVQRIAAKLRKTAGQVLLKWSVQQNVLVIPRSKGRKHIEENIDLNFEIPENDMEILNSLEQSTKYAWNPEDII